MLPAVHTDQEWQAVVWDEKIVRPAAEDLAARLGLAGAGLRGHRSHAAVLDFPRLRQARPTSRLHALVGGRTLAVPLAMRR